MILTEEEAKTKWCPQVRTDGIAANRDGANPSKGSMCFASGCMMWRWHQAPVPDPEKWSIVPVPSGYCGLAGNAEYAGASPVSF